MAGMRKIQQTIGLMSGTSLDGVDAAWIETDGVRVVTFGPAITLPYGDRLRADLRRLIDRAPDLPRDDPFLYEVTARMTEHHEAAVAAIDRPATLIGFHGQTILHRPDKGLTWQIGDAAWLAARTGITVVHDFRTNDVAMGGQGAPLVPVFHAALAAHLPKPLAVLNIGGVANLTWIGADGVLLACDTGPGCALIDDWAGRHTGCRMDCDGALAASGQVDTALIDTVLAHPFFRRTGPKSLDRQDFAAVLTRLAAHSPQDGAATLAALTAACVAATSLPAPPRSWLVCGGGRHNPAIMAALRVRLAAPVMPVESVGWDGDAIEAQCFGFLAARVVSGLPLSFPGTTGVLRPCPGGAIASPKAGGTDSGSPAG